MPPIRNCATAFAVVVSIFVAAGSAGAATVYNNIPSPLAGNYPSQSFEATQTAEFGGQVELAAGARTNPGVTVTMSSWGCQTGGWSLGTCLTTPGAVFSLPITLNIYAVNADNSVGALLASDTQAFKIPFRPSADAANCTGGNAGKWFDGTACRNGLAHNISWDLGGRNLTLPDRVIVAVMYNTSHYGYQPIGNGAPCYTGPAGCGYDSLNVAVVPNAPFVGTDPLTDAAYLSSTWSGAYNDGGLAQGILRLDANGWTTYRPAIRIETFPQQTGPAGADGSSCTVADNGDGTKTISCNDGTAVTVSDGASGATPAVTVARPNTKIVRAKIRAAKHKATFTFKGSGGTGKLTFQCRLDGKKFKSCRSSKTYRHLKRGKHVFRVRARGSNGKFDLTPASKKFKI
jgi:hypothetical protein